jgi:hypothetical protein
MPFYNESANYQNIVISFSKNPRYEFGAFAKGYHQAANTLCEKFLLQPGYRDYEGYPIVFLYRHAFELYLKNIIYWAARICEFKDVDNLDFKLYNTHCLPKLSTVVINTLKLSVGMDQWLSDIMISVDKISKEFDEIDPDSYSYRYPINTKGNESTNHHQVVNMRSIHSNMDKMLTYLEAVATGLDAETDNAQELYEMLNDYMLN